MKKWITTFLIFLGFEVGTLVAQSQAELFARPGVIGDSLSQGFFGATVEKKTQDWAYPVLVTKQAGSSLSYNVLKGPWLNFESILKKECGLICMVKSLIGGNASVVNLPTHAGITGAEYSSVLRTSGECQDVTARKWAKEWYWSAWNQRTYRWVMVKDCKSLISFISLVFENPGLKLRLWRKSNLLFFSELRPRIMFFVLHFRLLRIV